MTSLPTIKPVFKYIGGKTWLKSHLREAIETVLGSNSTIDTYCEPFCGGLGAFLGVWDVLQSKGIKNIILNDINQQIVSFYQNLFAHKDELIAAFTAIETDFCKTVPPTYFVLNKKTSKTIINEELKWANNYFNVVKREFNKQKEEAPTVKQSAILLFLQMHSFNGIYRENGQGHYNTPFNWNGKSVLDSVVEKINGLYQLKDTFNFIFQCQSFEKINYNPNFLYYLDPPYLNSDIGENKYHQNSFNYESQKTLLALVQDVNFIYSNHDEEDLYDLFPKNSVIKKVPRKNIISASKESRGTDKMELLVISKR